MRKLLLFLCLRGLVFAEALPYTLPPRPPDADRPIMVEDHPKLLFRTAAQLAAAYQGDVTGLADLRMSGSSEFNSVFLAEILQNLPTRQVIIVDLRQESHVLINDRLVTWEAGEDWANVGMDHDEAVQAEHDRIKLLTSQRSVGLVAAQQYDNGERSAGEAAKVETVRSEEQLVHSQGLDYERLTVVDHLRPDDEEVDRFVDLVDGLHSDEWVHFHCRAGVGRTSVFMAMFDMLHNADRVPLKEILARQAALPPGRDLNVVAEGPKHLYYVERNQFLGAFYRYSQARLAGSRADWSDWIREN
ncbi:MAG: hypothetical protein KF760_23375 [Candidatus Eremiobacteraeota bacterium]|nr:hypothetical protein [Candidatus Eremiobacteraeota bacterium]MCW5866166.1 hypothetical protein [Candidatus Eremiobacteraeota bacterium]